MKGGVPYNESCDLRCCPWLVFMRPNECLCILWPALINIDEVQGLLMRTLPERLDYDPVHGNTWASLKRDGQMLHIYNRSWSHHSDEDEGEPAGKWSSDKRGRTQFWEGWGFYVDPYQQMICAFKKGSALWLNLKIMSLKLTQKNTTS